MEKQQKQNSVVVYFKNLSKKDKVILTCTIILIAVAVFFKFLFFPQLDKYMTNMDKLAQLDNEYSRLGIMSKENDLLLEKNKELTAQYEVALNEIPNTPAVAQIIYDLKDLIKASKVEMKSLSFSSADVSDDEITTNADGSIDSVDRGVEGGEAPDQKLESQQTVKKQIVNMSVSGEYKNVINFIKEVEGYSRIAEVSNISMSSGSDKTINASLTANFYNLNYEEKESYEFNNGTYGKENSFN